MAVILRSSLARPLTHAELDGNFSTLDNDPRLDLVTQADAEAGTLTAVRGWSPERVKQAVDALALQPADLIAPSQGAAGFSAGATIKFWKGTAAEYDALTIDPDTVYFVTA